MRLTTKLVINFIVICVTAFVIGFTLFVRANQVATNIQARIEQSNAQDKAEMIAYVQKETNGILVETIVGVVIMQGIVLMVAWLANRLIWQGILKPIHQLSRSIADISHGKASTFPSTEELRTFGPLGKALKEMTQNLLLVNQALQNNNQDLEEKINERTQILQESNLRYQEELDERNRIESELQHRIILEKIVSNISRNLVVATPETKDDVLNHALKMLGEFSNVDRTYLFGYTDNLTLYHNTHEWCAPGIEPQIEYLQNIPSAEFPWWTNQMASQHVLHFPSLENMPEEAGAEKEILQSQSIISLLVVPMFFGNVLAGFIGFDAVRTSRYWNEEDINLLILLAEIIAVSQQRWKIQQEITTLNADLEQRVTERTAELTDLYNNAPCGYHTLDAKGYFYEVNDTELDWLGYQRDELVGKKSFFELLTPESQPLYHTYLQDLERLGQIENKEFSLFAKDGRVFRVLINASIQKEPGGNHLRFRNTMVDISQLKEAETALLASRDELSVANIALEKAARLKDEFLASMSHELRTPLTGIIGLSEALQEGLYETLNAEQEKAVKLIEESGEHLLELINDILDISKIEAGQLTMEVQTCKLDEICNASLQLIRGMTEQKQIQLSYTSNLPEVEISADPRRLKQILVNLLGNAVKFTPPQGKIGLAVTADPQSQQVQIAVWDTGIGISAENIAKLFKPFTQIDSSLARQYSGTGLGLSLVKKMLEMQGGSIQVESQVGVGSQFIASLPWYAPPQHIPTTHTPVTPLQFSHLSPALILENSPLEGVQLQRNLLTLGIRATVHLSNQNILKKISEVNPSLLLINRSIIDANGWHVHQLPQLTNALTIIISQETPKDSAPGQHFLVRPYTLTDLLNALQQITALHQPPTSSAMNTEPNALTEPPLILLAEDTETTGKVLTDYLRNKGYRVVRAKDGIEAVSKTMEHRPHLILMDVQMPGMDGLQAMQQIRGESDAYFANVPILALTALAMPGDLERCLQAGANGYLSKPINLKNLVVVVKEHLGDSNG
ncbi:MAG TPA: ATP-binding protein [Anaerolineales bacterium]|nr:ATP-binding protein [Anaerolineales bacterium]